MCDPLLDAQADLRNVGSWHNPVATDRPGELLAAVAFLAHIPLTLVATAAVIVLLWRRWRTGDDVRREQIRLFAIAAALPIVAGPVALATSWGSWIFAVAALPLPIAMGVAVLARGLYDLRNAVNRTLVWLTLSALVAGLYALVIGGAATLGHVDRRGRVAALGRRDRARPVGRTAPRRTATGRQPHHLRTVGRALRGARRTRPAPRGLR